MENSKVSRKKLKHLFIITTVFQVLFTLLFMEVIKPEKIFAKPIVESIDEFVWIGTIILGFVSSYIGYYEYKKISIVNLVISTLLISLYIFSTLLSCM